jgi:hypothetical protein
MKRAAKILRGAAIVTALLAIVAARVVWSSRTEWKEAQSAAGGEKILHLSRAARLYTPGNPFSRRALDALAEIGRAGGPDALDAWRKLRSAILATRSIYTPHPELLDEANQHIALLMAGAEPATRGTLDERRDWHAARLAQDDAPSVGWTLIALAGLAAWIGCALGFALRGLDEDDRLRNRPALLWAAGVAVGLTLFFVGLAHA